MAIITLTTDWGIKDHYVAATKGRILSEIPDVTIIDVSHQISRFDILQASFILSSVWRDYPKGTVHIIGINSIESDVNPHVIVEYAGHYFIGTDNGIFSLMFEDAPDKIFEINIHQDSDFYTFASKDLFAKVACKLIKGDPIEELGSEISNLYPVSKLKPAIGEKSIEGKVVYIDSYKNAITNISRDLFNQNQKGRKYQITAGRQFFINEISDSYADVPEFEILATFGTNGFLEIALNKSEATDLLTLGINDNVRIDFIES